jgi:hypothetical protein
VTQPARPRRTQHGILYGGVVLLTAAGWWWLSATLDELPPEKAVPSPSAQLNRAALLRKMGMERASMDAQEARSHGGPTARGPTPESQFKQRAESEWQGMLIDVALAPTCESTERCAFGQSCKRGACGPGEPADAECYRCLPCESDTECLRGEACVLDHCVKQELVSCRSSRDCPTGARCILSDYSTGARHNGEMRAYCPDINSGTAELDGAEDDRPPSPLDDRPPPLAVKLGAKLKESFAEDP